MNLEEYDFLNEMCLIALHISKEVKFAAVIDNNGKLIAGKYRKEDHTNNKRTKSRLLLSAREKGDDLNNNNINNDVSSSITFCHYNTNYLFYANYLTAAVKKIKTGIKYSDYREKEESVHHVELAEIHSILKIAITPLTANNDRYLCIYLESSSPNQEIIAKIDNTIWHGAGQDNDQYGHVDTCFENTREMQVIDGIDVNRFSAAVKTRT